MNNPYIKLKSFKYQACLLFSLFFCLNVYSQESSINLYSNWTYFPGHVTSHIDLGGSEAGYDGLSFSYKKINQNLRFHEFELKIGLRLPNVPEASGINAYNHFRYELGYQIPLGLSKKFAFEYGAGFKLYHYYLKIEPKVSTQFNSYNNIIGVGAAFLTGINYNINSKFYLQFKAILFDSTFNAHYARVDRPDLPESLRRNGNFDFDLQWTRSLRFGVGYKIGGKR